MITMQYIVNEIKLGIKDNIDGIKQIVVHPLATLKNIVNSIAHPIETVKNILSFARQSPIRFTTGLILSWAEGKIVSQISTIAATPKKIPLLEETILQCNTPSVFTNSTIASKGFQYQILTYFKATGSTMPTMQVCTGNTCTLTSMHSVSTTGATALSNSVTSLELNKKKHK